MGQWKRPRRDARSIIGYAVTATCLVVLGVVVVSQGWSAWPAGPVGGAALLIFWRQARCGIYVSGRGVRVIRFIGSDVVPWDQLVAVEVSSDDILRGGAYPTSRSGNLQIVFRTTSGTFIRTEVYRGFTGGRGDVSLRTSTFDRLVGKLRELHKQEQQDRRSSSL